MPRSHSAALLRKNFTPTFLPIRSVEWQGAGLYRPGQHRGSMYGGAQSFHVLRYGFDLEYLYLRLDPAESPARSAEVATTLKVAVLAPGGQRWVDFEVAPDGRVRTG